MTSANGSEGGLPTTVRRERVADAVRRSRYTSVTELATAFGVSEVTIRSDLDALSASGELQRVRGGAVHRAAGTSEADFEQEADERVAQKAAIGRAAAALVESGQTVMLGSGSTVAAVARALVARDDVHDLTVITNGLRVAAELERALPRFTVIVSGGTLRRQQHSLVNPLGTALLGELHAHITIVAGEGVTAEAGLTASNPADAEIRRLMLDAGRQRVVVADGPRVGEVSLVHVAPVGGMDLLVTDAEADEAAIGALREREVDVQIAGQARR